MVLKNSTITNFKIFCFLFYSDIIMKLEFLHYSVTNLLMINSDTELEDFIFTTEETKKLVTHIGSALSYMHRMNVIHNDIKCSNIMISPLDVGKDIHSQLKRENVLFKLIDHGLDTSIRDLDDPTKETEFFLGTKGYTCPQKLFKQPYDPKKSDVYSLGVVALKCLLGPEEFKREYEKIKDSSKQFIDLSQITETLWLCDESVSPIHKLIHSMLMEDEKKRPYIEEVVEQIRSIDGN